MVTKRVGWEKVIITPDETMWIFLCVCAAHWIGRSGRLHANQYDGGWHKLPSQCSEEWGDLSNPRWPGLPYGWFVSTGSGATFFFKPYRHGMVSFLCLVVHVSLGSYAGLYLPFFLHFFSCLLLRVVFCWLLQKKLRGWPLRNNSRTLVLSVLFLHGHSILHIW